jgi:hypothetical protein
MKFKRIRNFAVIIGVIVGFFGVIGGLLSLHDRWANRCPDLELFTPYNWSGIDIGNQKRFLCLYLRISNNSQRSAYLYLETMSVMVKINGNWYQTYFIDEEVKETDLPEAGKQRLGLGRAHFLNRFEDNVITFDKPLCGYIIVGYDNDSIFNGSLEEVKIEVEDCHEKKYILYTDLAEQLKRDPYRKYLDSLNESKKSSDIK